MLLWLSFFLIILFVFCPFHQELQVHGNCSVCCVKLFGSQVSENYSVYFFGKGRMLFNHPLGCVNPTLYIIRLFERVYHFRFLICYPCLFINLVLLTPVNFVSKCRLQVFLAPQIQDLQILQLQE